MIQNKIINVLTFHRAHNHGSVLQAYALQRFVQNLVCGHNYGVDYHLMDLHTRFQESFYSVIKPWSNPKNVVKNIIALLHYKALCKRHQAFEKFIKDEFNVTPRYYNAEELKRNPPKADYFITGSDQIWNVRAQDFSEAYYLPFVVSGKRISYAASFGPLKIDWDKYDKAGIAKLLSLYDVISVRETGSADNVEALLGKRPEVHVDPTFLLTVDEWREVQSSANYKGGKYILLYCLEPSKQQLKWANTIGRNLGLPVVVTRYNNKNDWFNPFVHLYASGPRDFLSLVDHAALVLTGSFHGTAFSIIYHKPFYVFNGLTDNRISSILTRTDLQDRSIESADDIDHIDIKPVDAAKIDKYLDSERQRSADFLSKALDLF